MTVTPVAVRFRRLQMLSWSVPSVRAVIVTAGTSVKVPAGKVSWYRPELASLLLVKPIPLDAPVMVTLPRTIRRFSPAPGAKNCAEDPSLMSPRTSSFEAGAVVPMSPLPDTAALAVTFNRAVGAKLPMSTLPATVGVITIEPDRAFHLIDNLVQMKTRVGTMHGCEHGVFGSPAITVLAGCIVTLIAKSCPKNTAAENTESDAECVPTLEGNHCLASRRSKAIWMTPTRAGPCNGCIWK